MIEIMRYNSKYKEQWDNFITNSKNGIFLFYRDYMEYHSDRFKDYSLLFFKDNDLKCVLPGNIINNVLYSHGGLTFGGIISNNKMKAPLMLEIFHELKGYLKEKEIEKVIYKAIPYIYSSLPAEEDLYALFVNNSNLIRRDISSAIFMNYRIAFSKGRKWNIKTAKKNGIEVKRSNDYDTFMDIEEAHLKNKYGIKPTHTKEEMKLLSDRFPNNIKLFTAENDRKILSGIIVYESKNVAHTQYIASTDEGKKLYAADLILDYLINNYYKNKRWFDFGISTENNGLYLNRGLILFKERFGARSIAHDFYEINIK